MSLFDMDSALCEHLPRRFLQFLRSAGVVVGEVEVSDLWAVVHIHVAAVKAPPDNFAQFGFGASAGAMGPLLLHLRELDVGLGTYRLRNAPFLLC